MLKGLYKNGPGSRLVESPHVGHSFGLLYCVHLVRRIARPAYGGVVDRLPAGQWSSQPADIQKALDRRKTGQLAPCHAAARIGCDRDPPPACTKDAPTGTGASASSSATRKSAPRTNSRSRTRSRHWPRRLYDICRSTALRDARGRRARGRIGARDGDTASPPARSPRSGLRQRYGVQVRAISRNSGRTAIRSSRGTPWTTTRSSAPNARAHGGAARAADGSRGCAIRAILRRGASTCREGVPVGWGEPVYGRAGCRHRAAMMGINAGEGRGDRAGLRRHRAEGQP